MHALLKTMRLRIALILGAVLVIAAAVGVAVKRNSSPGELISVERGTVTQEVIVTGKTKPVKNVDLAFEQSGRVASVHAALGERVAAGAVLVNLEESGLLAQLAEADANLAREQAKLKNAELAVEDARRSMADGLQDAYTKSDDAVRNRVDQLFSNARSGSPQLNFAADAALENAIESERVAMESLLTGWQRTLPTTAAPADLDAAAEAAQLNLARLNDFLGKVAFALNALRPSQVITQSTIDVWRADVSTARTNVNTAASNLSAAEEKLRSAPGDVEAQKAESAAAEAKVKVVRAEIAKTALRAPFSGVVTRQDTKVGEIVAANAIIVSLISSRGFEIEANVPEVDIGKLKVGNPVRITLDAFPGVLEGRLIRIDPAETIVDGVVNFRVSVAFAKSEPRLKSGLTTNLAIETERKSNVLILPQVAIIENDRGTFVRVRDGNASREIPVAIGIRGQDGGIEIVSGLREGERVFNIGRKGNEK